MEIKKDEWINKYPVIKKLINYEEVTWFNPKYTYANHAINNYNISISDMVDAEARLIRFAPFLRLAFPKELYNTNGIIESELIRIPNMGKELNESNLLLKCDNSLPISGSIKARGGIYEILRYAESLLIKNSLISVDDDYSILNKKEFKNFFKKYEIVVSSTGNLGLSIGIISAKLGFKVNVHMSSDAKEWKKKKLRDLNVNVIEHKSDFSKAVEIGREESKKKPNSYFVDDENSPSLFMGYAVAGFRILKQLNEMKITISKEKHLFVYLPCGVGGGPGGITFGLKQLLGDRVHCFFIEPTHAPSMLLGLLTGEHDNVCVQDFGIDNITEADGLAVGRPSKFVGKIMDDLLAGILTVNDDKLFKYLQLLYTTENIKVEPSALAGFKGLEGILDLDVPLYNHISITPEIVKNATHIVWSTGGNMVPEEIMDTYIKRADK